MDLRLESGMDDEEMAYDRMIDCRVGSEGRCAVPPEQIQTGRGATSTISVSFRERGVYRLTLTLRARVKSSLAQVPMSIYRDKALLKEITLIGADTAWRTVEIDMPPSFSTFYLRLYFAQAGMEIQRFGISLVQSMEEQIRQRMARMNEEKEKDRQ